MREFKVGDRVWSVVDGFGNIESTKYSEHYPISVLLDKGGSIVLTGDLKYDTAHLNQIVFHADEIPDYYKQFIKDERIGKVGYFWDNISPKDIFYSILTEIDINGKYMDSRNTFYSYWDNFSLTPPELK